jgi:RNA polymerase sigma-70 factor (ECF subfamily)
MKGQKNNGTHDSFGLTLVQMQDSLFYYALQLTEDREDARDLVQETSYKALKNRKKLLNDNHVRAWLYTILKNTYINYLRSSQFRQLVYDTDEMNASSEYREDRSSPPPDEILLQNELRDTIATLPGTYGQPLRLMLSGYSYKEIAQEMSIPIGTVKSRIHLGKKQIRKSFDA